MLNDTKRNLWFAFKGVSLSVICNPMLGRLVCPFIFGTFRSIILSQGCLNDARRLRVLCCGPKEHHTPSDMLALFARLDPLFEMADAKSKAGDPKDAKIDDLRYISIIGAPSVKNETIDR